MELPVYENQVPVGTLRIRTQGLYTLFETRLPPGPGLSRLWLLGAGRRWSLGLLEPREEGRFLRRRLTRLQLTSLPPRIDTVLVLPSDAPAPSALPPPSQLRRDSSPDGGASSPPPRGEAMASPLGGSSRGTRPIGAHSAFRTPNSEFSWTRLPDGSLLDPARRLLALPCAPGAAPENVRKITLDGREYWLFRT